MHLEYISDLTKKSEDLEESKESYGSESDPYSITDIINNVFLSNLLDKKTGHAYLVDINVITTWHHLRHIGRGIPSTRSKYNHVIRGSDIPVDLRKVCTFFTKKYPIINHMLKLANGKISLAGGSIIYILNQNEVKNDFDLFFHTGNVTEAEDLLRKCLDFIHTSVYKKYKHGGSNIHYSRSQGVQTVEFNYKSIDYKIQFIKRVYETKDQVLLGFD